MSEEDNSEKADDPLNKILTDKDKVDREQLANALEGVIEIDKDSGEPVKQDDYDDLDDQQKLVAHLLSQRAAIEKDILAKDDLSNAYDELAELVGVGDSTIRSYVSLDFISNDNEYGGYYIPGHSIKSAASYLEEPEPSNE